MGLLLDEDYETLSEKGIAYEKDESTGFLIFSNFDLPDGLYCTDTCAVLVIISDDYPDSGIDCLWVKPHLTRQDGKVIPRASTIGANENHQYKGEEYCRWSRHWGGKDSWKRGESNVNTILRALSWAFANPDAK